LLGEKVVLDAFMFGVTVFNPVAQPSLGRDSNDVFGGHNDTIRGFDHPSPDDHGGRGWPLTRFIARAMEVHGQSEMLRQGLGIAGVERAAPTGWGS
jgi:hypothetical protein